MNLSNIVQLATAQGWSVQQNEPLAPYTTFRVGGPADVLVTVPDGAAASMLLAACRAEQIPTFLLGNGSNLLIGDKGIRGVVWRLDAHTAACRAVDKNTVTCDAGLPLSRLCNWTREHALSGLEFAFGIPGTVGGALYMNAGAYDGQMADVVISATVLDAEGNVRTVTAEEMQLGYRHSAFMDSGEIVVDVTFRLQEGDADVIRTRMQELMDRRREKQPLEYPSAGSFFKRPTGYYAGALIEQCGLKGFAVGGAAVSEKHAGFVINKENATAKDVCELRDAVIRRVKEQTGVTLQPEVRFVGEF